MCVFHLQPAIAGSGATGESELRFRHYLRDLRTLSQDVSVRTAIDVLQSAVQKLKAGFDDFEVDLQKVRKRTLVDQGVTSVYTTMIASLWKLTN